MIDILIRIYHSKWFPRFFYKKPDGGNKSGVTGYFLIEWKILFSIGILHFKKGSREAYHNHAFNAITWWLKGSVTEDKLLGGMHNFYPSIKPKITMHDNFHKVHAHTDTYAITFRGPWKDTWNECIGGEFITLTHGRKVINPITKQERMRWVDTCSVSAMPQYNTAIEGVVVRRYKIESESYNRDPQRSCGNIRIECFLSNGTKLDRFASEFKPGKDGVLEYWN